jgi:large subunit ribosomal protein L1
MVGKRLRALRTQIDGSIPHSLAQAVEMVKKSATAKFDETIDLALNLNVDPKKADQNLRGVIQLPHGTGKICRVAVFAQGVKAEEARSAGADLVGAEELVEQIQKGVINFDWCVATPDLMAIVGKVAKILGPKGLMPNPKLGTVTLDVSSVIRSIKSGQVEYRTDKGGIIHSRVGKASFSEQALVENILTIIRVIEKNRPTGVKGNFIKKLSLSSTMGPSVQFVKGEAL